MSELQQFLYVVVKENCAVNSKTDSSKTGTTDNTLSSKTGTTDNTLSSKTGTTDNTLSSKTGTTDTKLRIVYWAANEDHDYDAHFVIYGKRPKSKITGKFIPYRIQCRTIEQVNQFVKTVVSPDHDLAIELHQFYGYTDDSEDWYNIDWKNTANNSSTELVAFDVESKTDYQGDYYLGFQPALTSVLTVLVNHEVV